MEDSLERDALVKDLYATFQKVSKKEYIEIVVRKTNSLSITEMIDACKSIECLETMPQNLGSAIYRRAMDRRMESDLRNHAHLKNDCPLSHCVGAKGRFLKLLKKSIKKYPGKVMYDSFWQTLNALWDNALDEKALNSVMDQGEKWFDEMMEVA